MIGKTEEVHRPPRTVHKQIRLDTVMTSISIPASAAIQWIWLTGVSSQKQRLTKRELEPNAVSSDAMDPVLGEITDAAVGGVED